MKMKFILINIFLFFSFLHIPFQSELLPHKTTRQIQNLYKNNDSLKSDNSLGLGLHSGLLFLNIQNPRLVPLVNLNYKRSLGASSLRIGLSYGKSFKLKNHTPFRHNEYFIADVGFEPIKWSFSKFESGPFIDIGYLFRKGSWSSESSIKYFNVVFATVGISFDLKLKNKYSIFAEGSYGYGHFSTYNTRTEKTENGFIPFTNRFLVIGLRKSF